MDGFNVIPISPSPTNQPGSTNSATSGSFSSGSDFGIEIIDEEKEKARLKEASKISWTFILSIISMIACVLYFLFLVFDRITMISQIGDYTNQMVTLGKQIDLKEMRDFQAMDLTLKTIHGKLNNHVLVSDIFDLINQNIRNNLEITDYALDVKDKEVDVTLSAIAPSFKELAEQTEKLFEMKDTNQIKSFSVSNLSFEAQTRRLHFNLQIVLDKSKVTAAATDTTIQPAATTTTPTTPN